MRCVDGVTADVIHDPGMVKALEALLEALEKLLTNWCGGNEVAKVLLTEYWPSPPSDMVMSAMA